MLAIQYPNTEEEQYVARLFVQGHKHKIKRSIQGRLKNYQA